MKFADLIAAQEALTLLSKTEIKDFGKKYRVYKLVLAAREALTFYAATEKELMEKNGGSVDEKGGITFATIDGRNAFLADREKLNGTAADVAPVTLKVSDAPGIDIDSMVALTGVVDWEE